MIHSTSFQNEFQSVHGSILREFIKNFLMCNIESSKLTYCQNISNYNYELGLVGSKLVTNPIIAYD